MWTCLEIEPRDDKVFLKEDYQQAVIDFPRIGGLAGSIFRTSLDVFKRVSMVQSQQDGPLNPTGNRMIAFVVST